MRLAALTGLYVAVVCSAQIGANKIVVLPWWHLKAPGGTYAVGLALSHRRRRWLLAGAVAAGILVAAIPPVFHRLEVEFQNVNGSTFFGRAGRIELWKATIQMLREHPIFGAGLSGFADRIAPFWNATHPERFIDPHNIVLNFWVETGVLGVIAMAWILVLAFQTAWWGSRGPDRNWRAIEIGILLALVAVVVHGLVDVPYFKNDLSLQFWTLLGLAWAGAGSLSARSSTAFPARDIKRP